MALGSNEEIIVLEVDERPAVQAAARANAAVTSIEQASARAAAGMSGAVETQAQQIVRITDRSRRSIEQIVSQAERRAAGTGTTPLQKLMAERDMAIEKLKSEPAAIDRVTRAYERMIAAEELSIRKAHELADANKRAAETAAIEMVAQQAERRAAFAGKSGIQRLIAERDEALSKIKEHPEAIRRVNTAYAQMIAAEEEAARKGVTMAEAMRSPLETLRQGIDNAVAGLGRWGVAALAAAAGAGVIAKAWYNMTSAQMDAAESMVNLADRTGLTLAQVDRLQAMAKVANINVESLETASRTLAQALAETGSSGREAREALGTLGVSINDISGAQRDLGQVTLEVIEKLSRTDSAVQRNALATRLLGRGAVELLPLIKNYAELDRTVRELGFGTRDALITSLAEADDRIDKLRLRWDILKGAMAAPISAVIDVTVRGTGASLLWTRPGEARRQMFPELTPEQLAPPGVGSADTAFSRMAQDIAKANRERLERDPKERLAALNEKLQEARRLALAGQAGQMAVYEALQAEQRQLERMIQVSEQNAKLREQGMALIRENMRRTARGGELEQGQRGFIPLEKLEGRGDFQGRMVQEFREAIQSNERALEMQMSTTHEALGFQLEAVDRRRQAELQMVETVTARDLQAKLALEQRKVDIEKAFMLQSFALKAAALEREQAMELAKAGENAALRGAIIEKYGEAGRQLMARTTSDLEEATVRSQVRAAQMIQSEYERTYESLKRGFEGVFDALLTRTRSFGDLLKTILMSAVVTPIKEAAASWFAAMMVGGSVRGQTQQAQQQSFGAQMAGGFGGLLGFGGAPGFGSAGNWPAMASGAMMPGGARYGITPPFMPSQQGGVYQQPGGFGQMASPFAGFSGMGKNLMGGLARLGNLGRTEIPIFGGGTATTGPGVYGATGGAMLLGGGALVAAGLYRGGLSGLGMATAGGALIGAKFGGPVGAVIGAVVGAGAGLVRLFIKGAEQKAIDKVKSMYGITIDKNFAKTLVQEGKQFGGLDLFLASDRGRELIYLYAEMTNQGKRALNNLPRGVNLEQRSGTVYQTGTFVGGQGYSYGGTIQNLGNLQRFEQPRGAAATGTGAVAPAVTYQLDEGATERVLTNFLRNGIIQNPVAVQTAANNATAASAGRTTAAANILDPFASIV